MQWVGIHELVDAEDDNGVPFEALARVKGAEANSPRWIKAVKASLPPNLRSRDITVFAPTAGGDKALVCRFVRPQPPPPAEMMAADERKLLRFVSHIPFIDDAALGANLDVWNTTASFLDLLAGDAEEHALLHCNLFLHLGKKAYVLIGD